MNFHWYSFLIILIPVSFLIVQVIYVCVCVCACVSELGMRLAIIALIFWCMQLPTSSCSVLLQVLGHICSSLLLSQVTFCYSLLESKPRLGDLNVIKGQQTCSGNSRPGLDKYAATFQLPEVATSNTRSYRFPSSSLWNPSSRSCSLLRV